MARLFVAMSGGVDSSVAAALLAEEGHDVVGVTMQLWPSGDAEGGCCSVSAADDARRVCDVLGVPHYTLNFRDSFRAAVVEPFAEEYAAGRTPNPCVVCNDRVKFVELLRRALEGGAEALATGHYARIVRDPDESLWLQRGIDHSKDQSYFLYRMTPEQLAFVRFPLGDLTKDDVRRIARERGLPTASKTESQEICFIPADDHAAFVGRSHPEAVRPGPILDTDGSVVGTHRGLAHYTVGQRKGLGGGGGAPRYVVALRPESNAVVVGDRKDLLARHIVASDPIWRGTDEQRVSVQVRYRAEPVPAVVRRAANALHVRLDASVTGVAPGQSVVCYSGDRVLGGGVVSEAT